MHRLCSNPAVGTAYDGNGNVSGLVDSADGSLDAKYEYGAFGETLRVSGDTIAADNPFRFSTKYLDSDEARQRVDGDAEGVARRAEEAGAPWALMRQTGLIYYGFRYYSASLGRFLNRDPLGEAGGSNLYSFVENDPVNGWDYLGLTDVPEGVVCDPAESAAGLCDDDLPIYEIPLDPELPPIEVFPMPPPDPDPHPIDIEFPTEEPPDLGEREAPLGPNGGGGGTKKDGCDEPKSEKEEEKEKTDCEKFVDELVDLAEFDTPWWRYNNARVSTGYGMMSASWYDQRFWNGTPYHPGLGSGRLGGGNGTRINYAVTGFRSELVDHGQNSNVMKHVLGHAGVHVAGTVLSLTVGFYQNTIDQAEANGGRLQSQVELLNNEVGKEVGQSMVDTFKGSQSKADLRKNLMSKLCALEEL